MGRTVWLQGVGAHRPWSRGCEERLQSCTTAAHDLDKALCIGTASILGKDKKDGGKARGQGGQRALEGLVVEGGECCLEGKD